MALVNFLCFNNSLLKIFMDPDKVSKIWKVVKQIIDLVIAALAGAATASVAQSCGLLALL